MDLNDTNCCAVMEMAHISENEGPEEVIREVCESVWGDSYYDPEWDDPPSQNKPQAFYTFTGVVGYKKGSDDEGENTDYAPKLAAYIRRHKLGIVTESPARYNRTNHPDHKVRVYVWAPSARKLKEWWNKRKPERERVSHRGNSWF